MVHIYLYSIKSLHAFFLSKKLDQKCHQNQVYAHIWCLEIWYTILTNVTRHIYILLKYIDCVPVSFSFIGFDICAQKFVGWVSP